MSRLIRQSPIWCRLIGHKFDARYSGGLVYYKSVVVRRCLRCPALHPDDIAFADTYGENRDPELEVWKVVDDCRRRVQALGMQNTYGLADDDRCALDLAYRKAVQDLLQAELHFLEANRESRS